MTRDEVQDLVRESGLNNSDQLQSFAKAIASAQAERCAKLIWRHRSDWMQHADWSRCEDACALMAKMEFEVKNSA